MVEFYFGLYIDTDYKLLLFSDFGNQDWNWLTF